MANQDIEEIPQPPTDLLLGNMRLLDRKLPVQSMAALANKWGPIYRLEFSGGRKIIMVASQEIVNELCDETRFKKFIGKALAEVRAFAGDGLFTAHNSEPNWLTAHRILMPACKLLNLI